MRSPQSIQGTKHETEHLEAIGVSDRLSGGAFAIGADSCNGAALGAGKDCAVSLSYTPSAVGASDSGTLTITDSVDGGYSIPLSGTGK